MSMTGWLEKFGEGSGTDDFGFSGLPGGSYSYNLYEETVEFDGANDDYGDYGCWWSSSTKSGDNWSVQLPVHSQGRSLLKKYPLRSCTGASVRCLKDTERQRAGDKEDPLPIIDGYTYKTVKIGDQEWFAENLRTTVYANGDEIPYSRTDESWTTQEMGMRCSHHHADSMNVKYGQLYNWYTVDD